MVLNLATRELFTDAGMYLKTLHCPLRMRWDQLREQESGAHRTCEGCGHAVLNTAALTDEDLASIISAAPHTCVAVSAAQANVTIDWSKPGGTKLVRDAI